MPISRPDLVVLDKEGRAVAVVEAKARSVPVDFREPVLLQLRNYATHVNSPWSILVDPQNTTIFRSYDFSQPVLTLSTQELFESTELARPKIVGERTLVFAFDKWLSQLPRRREFLARHPELTDFAREVAEGTTSTEEWPPRRKGGP